MVELDKNDMKSFVTGNMRLTKVEKNSVKILDKNLFMNWLEEKGVLRDSLNVSAAKATQIWNEEFEIAKENNNTLIITDGIPGLSDPEVHSVVQLYGGK